MHQKGHVDEIESDLIGPLLCPSLEWVVVNRLVKGINPTHVLVIVLNHDGHLYSLDDKFKFPVSVLDLSVDSLRRGISVLGGGHQGDDPFVLTQKHLHVILVHGCDGVIPE